MMRHAEVLREMARRVNEGLEEAATGLEEEVRLKIRVLSGLGRGPAGRKG